MASVHHASLIAEREQCRARVAVLCVLPANEAEQTIAVGGRTARESHQSLACLGRQLCGAEVVEEGRPVAVPLLVEQLGGAVSASAEAGEVTVRSGGGRLASQQPRPEDRIVRAALGVRRLGKADCLRPVSRERRQRPP